MNKGKNTKGKQLRKPISNNFSPKRLAINFDPPMIIIQYLVVDTGKLYHHKMRLDSVLRKQKVTREDILNYIKTKHHLYFANNKIKDAQLYKFIDKILSRKGIAKPSPLSSQASIPSGQQKQQNIVNNQSQDDFQYLNDEGQEQQQEYYEQDYEDYEDASNFVEQKTTAKTQQISGKGAQKNAFMAYCQEYEQQEQEGEGHAEWDLDMDENDDFV